MIKIDDDMRNDTLLIIANSKGVNFLTPSIISEEGDSACYKEVKVKLEALSS